MHALTHEQALSLAERAKDWPSVADYAARYGIPGRSIRRAIADGHLPALRLNVLRINPDDFAGWLRNRQS